MKAERQSKLARLQKLDLTILQTLESVKALFHKMHALETAVTKSNLLFLRLLDDPETRQHAAAIAKEYGIGVGTTVKPDPK